MNEALDLFLADHARLSDGGPAVLATLIATRGAASSKLGAKLWITEGGTMRGSLTLGSCTEGFVRREAEAVARGGGSSRLLVALGDGEHFDLGMSCTGHIEVLLERVDFGAPTGPSSVWARAAALRAAGRPAVLIAPLSGGPGRCVLEEDGRVTALGMALPGEAARERALALFGGAEATQLIETPEGAFFLERWDPPEKLLIVGAGPIAEPLARLGKTLGFHVTVVDGRPELLERGRFPEADVLRGSLPDGTLDVPVCDAHTHVVIAVHNYGHEVPVLERVLASPAPYVAMIAGRRRGRAVLDFLALTGVAPTQLARVRTPAGLDLGASSPAGIALSVLSEIVGVAHGRVGGPLTLPCAL